MIPAPSAELQEVSETRSARPVLRPALRAINLGRRFGKHWVFRGLSLAVGWGEVIGLVGANGSGKTTLLRVLAGGLRSSEGAVWTGKDRVPTNISFMAGDAFLYDDLTAAENLHFASRMHGVPLSRARCSRALTQVGLSPDLARPLRAYSSGMRRRVALARALVGSPQILLLDEPYASLDDEGAAIVDRVVRSQSDSGGAVILVTHRVDRASAVCDRFLSLRSRSVRGGGGSP